MRKLSMCLFLFATFVGTQNLEAQKLKGLKDKLNKAVTASKGETPEQRLIRLALEDSTSTELEEKVKTLNLPNDGMSGLYYFLTPMFVSADSMYVASKAILEYSEKNCNAILRTRYQYQKISKLDAASWYSGTSPKELDRNFFIQAGHLGFRNGDNTSNNKHKYPGFKVEIDPTTSTYVKSPKEELVSLGSTIVVYEPGIVLIYNGGSYYPNDYKDCSKGLNAAGKVGGDMGSTFLMYTAEKAAKAKSITPEMITKFKSEFALKYCQAMVDGDKNADLPKPSSYYDNADFKKNRAKFVTPYTDALNKSAAFGNNKYRPIYVYPIEATDWTPIKKDVKVGNKILSSAIVGRTLLMHVVCENLTGQGGKYVYFFAVLAEDSAPGIYDGSKFTGKYYYQSEGRGAFQVGEKNAMKYK